MPAPLRLIAHAEVIDRDVRAGLRQRVERLLKQIGPTPSSSTSPPVIATASGVGPRLDAVGKNAWRAPLRRATPSTSIVDVPAPDAGAHLDEAIGEILHLGLARGVAYHASSHARAKPPSARCACLPTVTLGNSISPPTRPFGAVATT